jgi:VWFA-related protein
MRKALAFFLATAILSAAAAAQTTTTQQRAAQDDEIVRITTQLIQVDAVVTDKNDQVIPDLKLGEFSVYDNGKKQDLQFIEYVGGDAKSPRVEGNTNLAGVRADSDIMRNVSAQGLHRVFAFVVDDLTLPFEDMTNVRAMLTDFVDKQMRDDDLVAIVRVVGSRGLLEQFTSDKPLLRRAIAELTPTSSPYSAFNNFGTTDRLDKSPATLSSGGSGDIGNAPGGGGAGLGSLPAAGSGMDYDASPDGVTKGMRALSALSITGDVVNNMKPLPGRKSVILISGGLPVFDSTQQQISINGAPISIQESRSINSNVSSLLRQLTDRASRAGVAINTLDIRGLKALRGVSGFTDPGNEAKSALMTSTTDNSGVFGRAADMAQFDNMALDTLTGHQGLEALAAATGGVSVINSNNFREGLDRVITRSSYYLLAYKPSEAFDGKFHKLQIKVDRPGAKVYNRVGYVATADEPAAKPLTKEQVVIKAAMSPLAKRDVDVTGALQYRFTPDNRAVIDVDLRVDANKLDFKQEPDGKYHTTLDVVGFLINRMGKSEDGFSQTINASLSPDEYKRALDSGIGYTGRVELPPGNYQLRAVVREEGTDKLGSLSKYIEVPDMTKKRLTMSSVFLHAIEPGSKQPVALTALRQISRKDDLRYSAVVYNAKVAGGKPQTTAQLIISRGDKTIFNQPVQTVDIRGSDDSQVVKLGQIGLDKLQPGYYVLTLIITDTLADKKSQTLARSIDFQIVN